MPGTIGKPFAEAVISEYRYLEEASRSTCTMKNGPVSLTARNIGSTRGPNRANADMWSTTYPLYARTHALAHTCTHLHAHTSGMTTQTEIAV